MAMDALWRILHLLAAVLWVGGMAFALLVLRPASSFLETDVRLQLWRRVMGRFLPLAGVSALVLLTSGHLRVVLLFGGFGEAPLYVHLKAGLAWLMAAIYLVLVLGPARRFFRDVEAARPAEAARALVQMRRLVAINLILGLVVLVLAAGRFG